MARNRYLLWSLFTVAIQLIYNEAHALCNKLSGDTALEGVGPVGGNVKERISKEGTPLKIEPFYTAKQEYIYTYISVSLIFQHVNF